MSEKLTQKILASISLTLLVGAIILATLRPNLSVMAAGSTIYVDDDNGDGPWDGTLGHPFQNITSGIANATAGDTVHVLNGTYVENVIVDKSISIKGDSRPIIDGLNDIGVEITADNVTVEGFEIAGSSYGVYTNASGFTITDNVFSHDDYGVYWDIDKYNLMVDYIVHDCSVKNNTFYMSTSNSAIYVSLLFNYNHQSGYNLEIGNIQFCDNTMFMDGTSAYGIHIDDLYVDYLDGGAVSVGFINMSGNRVYGGYTGIDFYGTLSDVQDVQANFGDVIISDNVMVNQSSDGMCIDYYDCTYLYGNTTSTYGSLLITGNTITSVHGADGIYLSDIGYWYDFYDNASLEVGHIQIEENTIDVGNDGIYFYGNEAGENLYDNSSFSMGNISVKNNAIISGGYGIEIDLEYFGYYMLGHSSFTMGDIEFSNNTIHSVYEGIYIDYLYCFGYEMYDYASFTMSNIRVSHNNITSSQEGIYVGYCEYFGEYMYGNSTYVMGNVELRGNIIDSADDGIYAYELCYEWGYDMNDNSSFTMGDILVNDNIITSSDDGIYIDYIEYFGNYMYDASSFTMGSIEFSGNVIISVYDGIYVYEFYEFGYYMYGNSSFTMGDILVNDNHITTEGEGIYVYYCEYFGESMYDNSVFVMGDLQFSRNVINSDSYGLDLEEFCYFGYYMYGASSFTMGNIEVNDNIINSTSIGMWLYDFCEWGYEMNDNSSFTMGSILVNNNIITSTAPWSGALYIEYLYEFGYSMYGNSTFTMNHIQIRNNLINSTHRGLYIEDLYEFGSYMYGASSFTMGNIEVCSNQIDSEYEGIYIDEFYHAYSMHNNSSFMIEDVTICDNTINSGGDGIYLGELSYPRFGYNAVDDATITAGKVVFNQNKIISGDAGMRLVDLENATIQNNMIQNSSYGLYLLNSPNNLIYHNIFNNTINAYSNWTNMWDNGYPSGGNYWSDYTGTDNYTGPGQNITGSDGIGDTPYDIQIDNQDRYPFTTKSAWDQTPPSITTLIQNPEIPDHLETVTIQVDVTDDESGVHNVTLSFSTDAGGSWINVTMEHTSGDTYQADIPGQPADTIVQYKIIAYDNAGNLAVENNAGAYYVYTVIPEFPMQLLMPITLISLTVALLLWKRLQHEMLHN
jgi:parallel beta-helix repeat protein